MYQRMYGVWLSMVMILVIAGCGSQQQALEKDRPGKMEDEIQEAPSIYPPWYEEEGGVSSDTANFYGYGMAVANDSTESLHLARENAQSDLRRAVDDSLERLRTSLIKKGASSFEELKNPDFILSLRNAISFVDTRATVGQQVVRKQKHRWVSFVRTHVSFKTVRQELKTPLSEYPAFYQALE